LTFGGREPSREDIVVVCLPAVLTALAFTLYDETSAAFHNFVEFASANTWQAVDGGAYLSDLLTPALNGPISTFVSLLFGSLSSMTLSNLYNRQVSLATGFAQLVEDIRFADIHFEYFPEKYKMKAKMSMRRYVLLLIQIFEREWSSGDLLLLRERRRLQIEKLMILLHDLSGDPEVEVNGRVLDEAYGALNRISDRHTSMAAVYDLQFPTWHYGNLALLGSSICTIFFILTDRSALVFLGAFQLRVCWSILVCTISVMGCVMYDLNTPLEGIFQIVKETDRQYLKQLAKELKE